MNRERANKRLRRTWRDMLLRCGDPKRENYPRYGGRGIKVCDEWKDFGAFSEWALANGYTDELTIDRINPSRHYEPSNCRWATQSQQQKNKRGWRVASSVFKGVDRHVGRWRAQASQIFLGHFTYEVAAALAYDKAALEMYGEYSHLNFPEFFKGDFSQRFQSMTARAKPKKPDSAPARKKASLPEETSMVTLRLPTVEARRMRDHAHECGVSMNKWLYDAVMRALEPTSK